MQELLTDEGVTCAGHRVSTFLLLLCHPQFYSVTIYRPRGTRWRQVTCSGEGRGLQVWEERLFYQQSSAQGAGGHCNSVTSLLVKSGSMFY